MGRLVEEKAQKKIRLVNQPYYKMKTDAQGKEPNRLGGQDNHRGDRIGLYLVS